MSSYVFDDVPDDAELTRLRQIESALDPASVRWLGSASLEAGSTCLEVGAGAGSMAHWLAEAVGPTGRVVALDIRPRFRPSETASNVEVMQRDIRDWDGRGEYALVHARYVLIHLSDFGRAIERMAASVPKGGWLVLEEPDFGAARFAAGPSELEQAFARVNAAIQRMFELRGMNPALGLHLPAILEEYGLSVSAVESETHLVRGGSPIARMMGASTEQLSDKYVETGLADQDDIEGYRRLARDPSTWAAYYATVRVRARR
jgi:SAM-dependent methyltransferase